MVLPIFDLPAAAEIRGFVDSKGYFCFPGFVRKNGGGFPESPGYEKIIEKASGMYKVEIGLVKAVIRAESNFNRTAVSCKGAIGLMQIMPETASLMEVKNPFDPAENILGGTRYLAMMLRKFNGDRVLALAAYNAGPEKVATYGGVPPYPETRTFIKRVLKYCRAYGVKG